MKWLSTTGFFNSKKFMMKVEWIITDANNLRFHQLRNDEIL